MDPCRIALFKTNPFKRPWMYDHGAAASSGKTSLLKAAIAGGITGGLEISITYPTEFVKTQLQLDGKGADRKYSGVVDCIKKTVSERGFFGLYRGLSILLYGSIPKSAVRFGSYETVKNHLQNADGDITASGRLFAGLIAGFMEAIFAVTPMETLKVKFINDMRSPTPRYKGFLHGVSLIIKEHGISGVYKGLLPTIMKQGSNQAMRFFLMETMKDWYKGGDKTKKVPKATIGCMGIVAGIISCYGNAPIDVIKTRMQGLEAAKYKNTFDCIIKMWQNEGFFGFYKGTLPRLGRVCLDVAITFVLYDSFMEWFTKVWPNRAT